MTMSAGFPSPPELHDHTTHWGETGGTPVSMDKEIRVNMGNSMKTPESGRTAVNGVSSNGCVENKGVILAPQVGLEPTTLRLTAEILIAASRCKHKT